MNQGSKASKFALIKRFVASADMPPGVIADFDAAKSILRIDRDFYDNNASEAERRQIWRTTQTIVIQLKLTP